ncbi:MAG: triose-phosphate isomerase [Nitrososphaera sp.]
MNRPFIINFKNYAEASAARTVELARAAQDVAKKLDVEIIVAPPQPSLALVCQSVNIPVVCQHVDSEKEGATTGFFVPEVAKSYGAAGSLVNHSEHRIGMMPAIKEIVKRLRGLGMASIVCARTPDEVRQIAEFAPDFIAIEPPELIGSGRAVSKENPAIITDSIKAAGGKSRVICGAGITDGEDVAKAIQLGSHGVLVASGIVKASSWPGKIAELASSMRKQ